MPENSPAPSSFSNPGSAPVVTLWVQGYIQKLEGDLGFSWPTF